MIIHPYNHLGAVLSDDGVIAANFPSCRFFLKCNDAAGNLLRDSISGKDAVLTANFTRTVTGAVDLATCTLTLPRTVTIGTSPALLLLVHYRDAIILESSLTNSGRKLSAAGDSIAITDGVNAANPALNPTEAAIRGLGLAFKASANEGTVYEVATSITSAVANNDSLVDMGSFDLMTFSVAAGNTISRLYGAALFVFDSGVYPPDVNAILAWQTAQWQANNKWIYPGLRYRN